MLYAWKSSTPEAEVGHCCMEFEDIEFEDILVNPGVQGCLDYTETLPQNNHQSRLWSFLVCFCGKTESDSQK